MRILIVEDQSDIASLIADRVGRSGYAPDHVGSLADALEALRNYDYPVMLLDRRLPDGDGVSTLPEMKAIRPGVRILLVTAARSIDERVNGLEAGADDYLTKPFAPEELIARIRASLRRPGAAPVPAVTLRGLSFDLNTLEASIDGQPFIPPRRELLLLGALMRRAGRAVTFATLIEEIYGADDDVNIGALKMLVLRLRQRLKDRRAGVEIHAPRGIGYLIREARA